MNRTDEKINRYLSESQSAYRKSRSTTDVVWVHRWIIAKAHTQDITVYVTGIDMSSVFDTIHRDKVIEIAEEILDEDEIRVLRILIAETTLEVKVENAQATAFTSNIGSSQGDSISGPLFTIYFNKALQQLNDTMQSEPIDVRDINPQWIERLNSNLPDEMEYADDCDFDTEMERKKERIYHNAKKVLTENNLLANEEKTENTTIKRGAKVEEA